MKKVIVFILILAMSVLTLSACQDVSQEKLPADTSADTGDNAVITESTVSVEPDSAEAETEPGVDDVPDNPEEPETDAVPQGYVSRKFESKLGYLRDNGNVGLENPDETAAFGFILPEDWEFDASVACVDGVKVFEIGGFFRTEELTADKVRLTPEGTEFPTTAENDEGGTETIYAEETSDQGVYDYMCHSSAVLGNGEIYETYLYIVSRGGYSVYVSFVVNDYYSPEICETVLNSFEKI